MSRNTFTLICLILLTGAPPATGHAEPDDAAPAAAHGAKLLLPFKQRLQAALAGGLAGGTTKAIDVCRVQAPKIAAALSVQGVRMGRTSHRLRNPANAPPPWAEPLLERYVDGERQPLTVAVGHSRMGYVEPILVQPQCLACHGSELAPEVASSLERLYPEDRATGFAAGDFRGLFWVEYPATE
jgi:hypothetical protein